MHFVKTYPRWRYHPEKGGLIVQSDAHERSLGDGWFDSPAEFPVVVPSAPAPDTRDAKIMELEAQLKKYEGIEKALEEQTKAMHGLESEVQKLQAELEEATKPVVPDAAPAQHMEPATQEDHQVEAAPTQAAPAGDEAKAARKRGGGKA